MKKTLLTLAIVVLSGLIFSAQALAHKSRQHQFSQQKRILHGIKSGQLNRHEARALRHEQRHIRHLRKSFWRDGHLSRKEKHRLYQWQRRANRHIWRLKHNNHRRHGQWWWQPHRHNHRHRWHIW